MVKLNTNTSIVDYLKSTGKDSSYTNRSKLASQNKINNYTGTASQNIQLLNILKTPKVVAPKAVTPKVVAPKVTTPRPVTTKSPVSPAPIAPAQPTFDPEAYAKQFTDQINNMFNQQRAAQLAQLQAQRDKTVGQINQQKAELKPMYQGMKNQTDAMNLQNVQKLRELMAANGLNASGENVSANVAANNERLNSINSLNLQEQQQVNDFNRRISDLNNPNDENALTAQLEAERSRALLEMGMKADEIGYSRSRDSESDKRYYDERDYTHTRDEKEWQASEEQRRQDNAWRNYTFNNMSASEKTQFEWAKSQFGEEQAWRMFELEYNGELAKSQSQAELDFYKSGFNGGEGGGGYSNNYKTEQQAGKSQTFKTYQNDLNKAIEMGVPSQWATALTELVGRESSWNPSAKNPNSTAHGYGQFLNSTRQNYEKKTGLDYDNPVHQLVMMARYVKDRYGSPEKALAFWDKNKWYVSPLVASISGLIGSLLSFNLF